MPKRLLKVIGLDYTLVSFAFSFLALVLYIWIEQFAYLVLALMFAAWILFKHLRGRLTKEYMFFYFAVTLVFAAFSVLLLCLANGRIDKARMALWFIPLYPFTPILWINIFGEAYEEIFPAILAVLLTIDITSAVLLKGKSVIVVCLVCAALANVYNSLYIPPLNDVLRESDEKRGHGFAYMHGWSSTDFTGFHVYDGEKLAELGHEPNLVIDAPDDMPVLDGAEACYPLYCAAAKAVYKNIALIESPYADSDENGLKVTFTNTVNGYKRLINGEADIIFGARPSKSQQEDAASIGQTIDCTVIGKEAFVIFVEEDNPVSNLTTEQLKDIYSGRITNWKELGGKNEEIVAFQRPENSGSQVMMEYFMGDTELKEPVRYEMALSMGGIVDNVSEYTNYPGAIGYSFRYFIEELHSESGVKILSINGVSPTLENIESGEYPLCADLVCAKLESNNKPYVQKMIDFMLSDDGRELIKQTGYAPAN